MLKGRATKISKKLVALVIMTAILLAAFALSAGAAEADAIIFPTNAAPVTVKFSGTKVLSGKTAIVGSVTYVALRSFAEMCGTYSITWNDSAKTATVTENGRTITVTAGKSYIEAHGRAFYTVTPVRIYGGNICVPIRALAAVFGLDLDWDAASRTVNLTKSGKALAYSGNVYNSEDLYWLARIISAESKGEILEGQIAVGNVILNRKAHRDYPNTVKTVIFDTKYGVQFTPVSAGTIYQEPTESSIIAAKLCLEGYSISTQAIFFMNPKIATSNWISKNCTYLFTIGNHVFYK